MLRPSDFVMNDFAAVACSQEALCVHVKPYKTYKDGVPGDVAGFTFL